MATILLVHGSFQGGWIWQLTATALRAAGHLVYAPTMEGCAERVHALRAGITVSRAAEELAELLRYEDLSDVVLAGTSSGGMVAAKTASLASDRISRIVFVDALVPQPGESTKDIVQRGDAARFLVPQPHVRVGTGVMNLDQAALLVELHVQVSEVVEPPGHVPHQIADILASHQGREVRVWIPGHDL